MVLKLKNIYLKLYYKMFYLRIIRKLNWVRLTSNNSIEIVKAWVFSVLGCMFGVQVQGWMLWIKGC